MNNRRKLIVVLGAGALAAPLASFAQQQGKVWRVGFLTPRRRPDSIDADFLGAFPRGMRELGYVEGKNLLIEWRFDDKLERLPYLAEELVGLRVDVIVSGSSQAISALQKATTTIPIVMATSGDPIGSGFVKSLARPGANITGFSNLTSDIGAKQLELLVSMGALAVAYLDHYRDAYLFSLDRLVERLSLADEQRLRRAAAPDPPIAAALADVGRVAGLGLTGTAWDTATGPHPTPDAIHVTPQRATHILHSDDTGGGHAPGTGRPGQSEFPRGWSDQRILTASLAVARAPEVLRRGRYGRWVAEGVEDGVRIRVVVGADGYVFTSVPLSGPGVVRNPGAR